MDVVLQWGIDLILWIQMHRTPALDQFFRLVTQLGGQWHMWIVPALIWCLSYRFGSRLLITLLLSAFVNFGLKDIFGQPRPFDLANAIGPDRELGHGIPSGHAQHTAIEWGALAVWVGRPWFTVVALALIVLIGFSRVYLGVHFPTDVLAGWTLAAVFFWAWLRHGDAIAARVVALGPAGQIALAAAVSAFHVLFYMLLPESTYLIGCGGLLFGAALGMVLCHRWLQPPEGGALWQRLLRYPLGMAPLLVWMKLAFDWVPATHELGYFVIIYLNDMVVGLWLTAGAPALFQLVRLSPAARLESAAPRALARSG